MTNKQKETLEFYIAGLPAIFVVFLFLAIVIVMMFTEEGPKEVIYEKHSYMLVVKPNNDIIMCHNPDCPCKNNKKKQP